MEFEIRQLTTVDELEKIAEVEEGVWNFPPLPVHQTLTAAHHGGIILGAFLQGKLIGFLYSFPGFNGKSTYLCSHMLGILPAYQKRGLGVQMKLKQAELAKEFGYKMITWTFDPLESKNAYFNIHKLGAKGVMYKENLYGDLRDKLNSGLPTDRIQIEWNVEEEPVGKRKITIDEKNVLNMAVAFGTTGLANQDELIRTEDRPYWVAAIPSNFQEIKKTNHFLSLEWRIQTRKVFKQLFDAGYIATDVIPDKQHDFSYYVFTKEELS